MQSRSSPTRFASCASISAVAIAVRSHTCHEHRLRSVAAWPASLGKFFIRASTRVAWLVFASYRAVIQEIETCVLRIGRGNPRVGVLIASTIGKCKSQFSRRAMSPKRNEFELHLSSHVFPKSGNQENNISCNVCTCVQTWYPFSCVSCSDFALSCAHPREPVSA